MRPPPASVVPPAWDHTQPHSLRRKRGTATARSSVALWVLFRLRQREKPL